MIVRGIDNNSDWLFGKGKNDYKTEKDAVAQMIQTTVMSFVGDCFFAVNKGIDWFNLLGTNEEVQLKLSIATEILSISEVTGIIEISTNRDINRKLSLSYKVDTIYGIVDNVISEVL